MTDAEVLMLLAYLNELDGRHSPNEVKVKAWKDVLDEAPGITLEFCRGVARHHYAHQDVMAAPALFVRSWNQSRRRQDNEYVEAHCRFAECQCTHTLCYRGWIDTDRNVTAPCRVCRASLAEVLDKIPEPGRRSEQHFSMIRNRFNH